MRGVICLSPRVHRVIDFLASHIFCGLLDVLAMYGVANVWLVFPIVSIWDVVMLYSWTLTLLILPIQAGVQIWSGVRLRSTPVLLFYYFQYDTTHNLPHHFLDPVRSRIGLVTVIILLLGALVAWPAYAVYGGFLLVGRFGFRLLDPVLYVEIVQAMAVGVSAIFVAYFALASASIIIVQWRRSFR